MIGFGLSQWLGLQTVLTDWLELGPDSHFAWTAEAQPQETRFRFSRRSAETTCKVLLTFWLEDPTARSFAIVSRDGSSLEMVARPPGPKNPHTVVVVLRGALPAGLVPSAARPIPYFTWEAGDQLTLVYRGARAIELRDWVFLDKANPPDDRVSARVRGILRWVWGLIALGALGLTLWGVWEGTRPAPVPAARAFPGSFKEYLIERIPVEDDPEAAKLQRLLRKIVLDGVPLKEAKEDWPDGPPRATWGKARDLFREQYDQVRAEYGAIAWTMENT